MAEIDPGFKAALSKVFEYRIKLSDVGVELAIGHLLSQASIFRFAVTDHHFLEGAVRTLWLTEKGSEELVSYGLVDKTHLVKNGDALRDYHV